MNSNPNNSRLIKSSYYSGFSSCRINQYKTTPKNLCLANILNILMVEIKELAITDNPKRKKTYEIEAARLKTAVIVVKLREQHGLSQQIFAEKTGVSTY